MKGEDIGRVVVDGTREGGGRERNTKSDPESPEGLEMAVKEEEREQQVVLSRQLEDDSSSLSNQLTNLFSKIGDSLERERRNGRIGRNERTSWKASDDAFNEDSFKKSETAHISINIIVQL